jgi:hypothetical protein
MLQYGGMLSLSHAVLICAADAQPGTSSTRRSASSPPSRSTSVDPSARPCCLALLVPCHRPRRLVKIAILHSTCRQTRASSSTLSTCSGILRYGAVTLWSSGRSGGKVEEGPRGLQLGIWARGWYVSFSSDPLQPVLPYILP